MSKKVKVKFTHDELCVIMMLKRNAATGLLEHEDQNKKLLGMLLEKVAVRMFKRAVDERKKYTFSYTEDEATAFVLCMNEHRFVSTNPWTQNLFRLTYDSIVTQLL
jgi:hypothetical protein